MSATEKLSGRLQTVLGRLTGNPRLRRQGQAAERRADASLRAQQDWSTERVRVRSRLAGAEFAEEEERDAAHASPDAASARTHEQAAAKAARRARALEARLRRLSSR